MVKRGRGEEERGRGGGQIIDVNCRANTFSPSASLNSSGSTAHEQTRARETPHAYSAEKCFWRFPGSFFSRRRRTRQFNRNEHVHTNSHTCTHTHTHCEDKQTEGVKKTRPCSRKFTGFFFFWFWLKNFPWHGLRGRGVKKYVAHSEREIKWDSEAYRGAKLRRWKEIKAPGGWSGAGWGNTFPYVVSDRFLKGLAKNTCWWETNNVLKWDESELRTKPIPHYELKHTAQAERSVLQGENLLIKPLCLRRHCYTATWLHLHEYIWKHLQKSQHLVFQRLGSSWMFRWGEAGRLSNMPHWFRKSFLFSSSSFQPKNRQVERVPSQWLHRRKRFLKRDCRLTCVPGTKHSCEPCN